MKAIVIAVIATVLSFIFLHKPLVLACGGRMKIWKLLVFDLALGVGVYLIAR